MNGVKQVANLPVPRNIDRISASLSFKLARLAAINERMGSTYFRSELGITLSEWRVIGLAAENNPAIMASIRETLLMDRGLLSWVVRGLCERDLLESSVDPSNKRQTRLKLTARGRTLHDKGIAFTAARNDVMADVLTDNERISFEDMLERLLTHNAEISMPGGHGNDGQD